MAETTPAERLDYLLNLLGLEIAGQDAKHGPFQGSRLGSSRLALACLQDEVAEALDAWRLERRLPTWETTQYEVLQVAAVALRALRDTFANPAAMDARGRSNIVEGSR